MSVADELYKLEQLRQSQTISDAEFLHQKQMLLNSAGGPGPAMQGVPPGAPMPPNYLAQAIIATLFCCLPLGVVAIIKASQVSSAYQVGNYPLAVARSNDAKLWVNIAAVAGVLVGFGYLAIMALGVAGSR